MADCIFQHKSGQQEVLHWLKLHDIQVEAIFWFYFILAKSLNEQCPTPAVLRRQNTIV